MTAAVIRASNSKRKVFQGFLFARLIAGYGIRYTFPRQHLDLIFFLVAAAAELFPQNPICRFIYIYMFIYLLIYPFFDEFSVFLSLFSLFIFTCMYECMHVCPYVCIYVCMKVGR